MSQQSSTACWVWRAAESSKDQPFKHPAEVPANDEATMLQAKGNLALIAENGTTKEVPKVMVLPWYEGLLLLEELEQAQGQPGRIPASWLDDELRAVLDKERSKFPTGRLNGALYTEKRLLTRAVTGHRFVDADDVEWHFRRERLKSDDTSNLGAGEDKNSFFRIKDITGYLPPWEAFHHEKCGFYQDFYQVKWEYPFSEVDYSTVENGSSGHSGATWEPDECLPAHLDPLRVAAKRLWIKSRRQEQQQVDAVKAPNSSPTGSVKRESDVPPPPAKMARTRRDGLALERDLLSCRVGHDFVPDSIVFESLGQLRTGWPKQPQDYPKGFAVASPPGFCWNECDCMDDQRPQRPWETRKAWLEDANRAHAAVASIHNFSQQAQFVRRRGEVSKMFYFETAQGIFLDQTHALAAMELCRLAQHSLQAVLQQIPIRSIVADSDPVRLPARAFLAEEMDYEPLRFAAVSQDGSPLPPWVGIDMDSGQISAARQPAASELPLSIQVELAHSEGAVALAMCTVVADSNSKPLSTWTVPFAQRFNEARLERGVRAAISEHFAEVYDVSRRTPRERSVGAWLDAMSRIMRLLRGAAGTNLALDASAHGR